MTYRDMTFCTREDCARFGVDCHRSLTEFDKARAKALDMPVSVSYFTECFVSVVSINKNDQSITQR